MLDQKMELVEVWTSPDIRIEYSKMDQQWNVTLKKLHRLSERSSRFDWNESGCQMPCDSHSSLINCAYERCNL